MANEGTSTKDLTPFSVEDPLGHGVQNSAEARLLHKIHESDEGRNARETQDKRSRTLARSGSSRGAITGKLAQSSASSSVANAYASADTKKVSAERWISVLLLLAVLYALVDWAMPDLWGTLDINL